MGAPAGFGNAETVSQVRKGIFQSNQFFHRYPLKLSRAAVVRTGLQHVQTGRDYDLNLYDGKGRILYSSKNLGDLDEFIETATLPAGDYFLEVNNFQGEESQFSYQVFFNIFYIPAESNGRDLPVYADSPEVWR